jgi:hypothetical protein
VAVVGVGVGVGVGVELTVTFGVGVDDGEADVLGVGHPVAVPDGVAVDCVSAVVTVGDAGAVVRVLEGDAVGWHRDVAPGTTVLRAPLAPGPAVLLAPFTSGPPPPFPDCEPLPPLPDPPDEWPPVRLEPTCMSAWRSGGSASVMVATKATPASATIGRSRSQLPRAACLPPGRDSAWGPGAEPGQAQCPRQTQYRARLTAPSRTLSSHGCGGRLRVLARMRSRPPGVGSTAPATANSSRRSAASRSLPGVVMTTPARGST